MRENKHNQVRADGTHGQIENIYVVETKNNHKYQGKVNYYSGSGTADYELIISSK